MVDYSKWKNIEISDDEDDTHPNIDTPSLFRWRHNARIERMEARKQEQEKHEQEKAETMKKLKETKEQLEKLKGKEAESTDLTSLKTTLAELEKKEQAIKDKEEKLKKEEKLTPWNVDTIAHEGFTKTVINKKIPRKEESLTDEEKEKRMAQFVKENKKKIEKYGMLRKYEDSRIFLQENPQLVCEDTASYLVVYCINLEMEEKHDLMEHVAHQCICMQYILELSKQVDVDPRSCVSSFFKRIVIADVEYKNSFDDEVRSFKERIRKRAAEKLADLVKEAEEEERQARLGPGGLDPVEVFESLPEPLQKCFESQNIPLLQETIAAMPEEEAKYHMKRCVDSGLWVPERKSKDTETEESAQGTPDPE